MAITNILVALVAVGLVSSACAYAELHQWQGLASWALYGAAGFVSSEFLAAPIMADLFGVRSGVVEALAMAAALAFGLGVVCRLAAGGDSEPI